MSLVTVGSVAFDEIITPFGESGKILGGAGTFISLAASLLGVENVLVSVVGEAFPQKKLDFLVEKGIDISGIEIKEGEETFFWKGQYHNDMNSRDTLITELNALGGFQPKVPANWRNPEVLMLGNLHPLVQDSVLNQVEKPRLVVLDTMNFWMDSACDDLLNVIKTVSGLAINH